MTYRNKATGFVFFSECKINAEGWECLDPQPTEEKEKPKKKLIKKEKKDE